MRKDAHPEQRASNVQDQPPAVTGSEVTERPICGSAASVGSTGLPIDVASPRFVLLDVPGSAVRLVDVTAIRELEESTKATTIVRGNGFGFELKVPIAKAINLLGMRVMNPSG